MPFLRHVIILMSLPSMIAAATTATLSTTCTSYITSTAKFDDLPTDKPIPKNYGHASWTGFTVVNLTSPQYDYGDVSLEPLVPESGTNAALYGYEVFASLSSGFYNDGTLVTSVLESFCFGCIVDGDEGLMPDPCNVTVLGLGSEYWDAPIQEVTFEFDAQGDNDLRMKMAKAALAMNAETYQFILTGGSDGALLFIDNVVIISPNKKCF